MEKKGYWRWMFPLCFLLIPILVQIIILVISTINKQWASGVDLAVIVALVALLLFGISNLVAREKGIPEQASALLSDCEQNVISSLV